jgi:hypothetical protein
VTAGERRPARSIVDWCLLAAGFLAVHVLLGWLDFVSPGANPAGDVTGVYRFWVESWISGGPLVGVGTDWVYPIAALPPMLLAGALGTGQYLLVWLLMVAVLDAVALVLLARRGLGLAWWWLAFTLLLGPVAPARIDAVALPIAIVAVLRLADRPVVAAALLTLAAWVKVWPAAIVAAIVVAGRRTAATIAAAAATSAAVVVVALLAGGGAHVLSFITAQATRGIQVEAPIALPWLWSAAAGDPDVVIYYDLGILTFQLRGAGVQVAEAVMTPVLVVGVLGVVLLALLARRRGADRLQVLAITAFTFVSAVIALNKVGSPQYLTWYVAPVLLGLLVCGSRFRWPALAVLVAAGLTQLIYPWFYDQVLGADPLMIAVLTVRNLIELGLLAWCLLELRNLPGITEEVSPEPARNAVQDPA